MIVIENGQTELLIDILREHIFVHTGDEYSDKATHPIEVTLLDSLIEKLNNAKRQQPFDPSTPLGDNFPLEEQTNFDFGE